MMHWFFWGFPYFMGSLHLIGLIIFILVIAFFIFLFTRRGDIGCSGIHTHQTHSMDEGVHEKEKKDDEALNTIRKLYAKGEISEEEYEKRKRNLEK